MRMLAPTCGALLLAGCAATGGPPPAPPPYLADLSLTADQPRTSAGSTITLTLTNNSAQPIGYDLCLGALERNVGGFWVPATTEYKACPQSYMTLQPGGSASAAAPVAATLETDDYRYVTKVTDLLGAPVPDLLRSNSFHVEGVPTE